jgi:phage repressor protein C with HTH and peptisase S24 domain
MTNFFDRMMEELEGQGVTDVSTLSRKLGYDRPEKLYRLKRNPDSKPSMDILTDLTNTFENIDLEYLITGKRKAPSVSNLTKVSPLKKKNSRLPQVITVDQEGNENILLVPQYAQAGYTTGLSDPDYIDSLPTYRLPKIDSGTYRMFEVRGNSMVPTLHSGSYAVGQWVESLDDIKDDQVYIVVLKDDGIVIKRLINRLKKYGNLYAKSDNRSEFEPYTIEPNDILEIWHLKTALVWQFSNPIDIYNRITDLEAEVGIMKSRLES